MTYNISMNSIFAILILAAIWIILCESYTLFTIVCGLIVGAGCVFFYQRLLPFPRIININPLKLCAYLLYLLGQMYLNTLKLIKIIISGGEGEVVEITTTLTDGFLRTLLANSITHVPGTVSLDMEGRTITVLRFRKTGTAPDPGAADDEIKGQMEKMLLKMEGNS